MSPTPSRHLLTTLQNAVLDIDADVLLLHRQGIESMNLLWLPAVKFWNPHLLMRGRRESLGAVNSIA